jgi:L-lactate dehydrogenase complex protein LldG
VEVAEERGAEKAVLCSRAYEAFAQEVFRELDEAGITVLEPEKGNRAGYERFAAQADVGVVFASAGVAVTGTAVVEGVPAQPRLPGILPPTLLVVVRRSTIFPTLEDALSQLSERNTTDNLPQNSSLLTGPSKSADIGMELVTNVHGPGDVHALVVTDR